MRNLRRVSTALLMIAVSAACQTAPTTPGPPEVASAPVPQSLGSRLRAAGAVMESLRRNGFSGSVAVVKDGRVLFAQASGEARPNARFTPGTRIDIASIAKPITAMAVLKLVQQGRLSLDDTIGRWFPNAPQDKMAITLRQLLSHSAGIADGVEGVGDYTRITTEEMADRLLNAPLAYPPGTKYTYSNGGFVVVTAIVQRASGEDLEPFLQREIFTPFRVSASYDPARFPPDQVADGLSYHDLEWVNVRDLAAAAKGPFGYLLGEGGLFISAPDLARLVDAFFSGRIVEQSWVDEARTPIANVGGPFRQGLGWVISDTGRGARYTRHTGGSNHSNTAVAHYPEARLTVVAVSNRPTPSGTRALKDIAATFVGGDFPSEQPPVPSGEPVPRDSQEARLARELVQTLAASRSDKARFVAGNFTSAARADGGAERITQTLADATRVGRPRIVSITRPAPGTLQIIAEGREFAQQIFWRATLATVMQEGRLLIQDLQMNLERGAAR